MRSLNAGAAAEEGRLGRALLRSRADPGPGWHGHDARRYAGAFAEIFGIRPWEVGLLSVDEFDALIDYLEERGG